MEVARRETSSVLRLRSYIGMSTLNFAEIIEEMKTLCPTVFALLSQMILLDHNPGQRTAPLALLYGIIMFHRCKEIGAGSKESILCWLQKEMQARRYIILLSVLIAMNNE